MSAPQRAQQGHLATPSVLMTTKAGTALEVEEGVKVARHGGVQSARLRPFLGIDLEKLPEGEENVDKVNTPRGSPEKAAEGCDMSQGRSAREGERASDEPKRMTDAPLEKEAASKSGRESEEGVNQSSQQKENTEGGGKEAVEGGVPKDPESPPEGGGAADPTEAPKQAEEDTAGDCKGGREESRKDGGKHTPEEGAIAESREERAPGSRGESEEKDVGKGDRGENSDAAGQQGSAERVGDKKGDRLRGGTRAEGSVMGAGPMEWRHDRPGDKHWHAGRERKSLEDPPKRKARDFGFAHQDVYKIRRRALQEGGLTASARSDFSLLDQLVGSSDQSGGLFAQGQDLQDGARQAGRGPFECQLCGAVFAYSQALGGHMRSHKHYGAPPQPPPEPFQLPRPPPSLVQSFASGARSSGGNRIPADAIAAALQALETPTLSLGLGSDFVTHPQENGNALGLAQAGGPGAAFGGPERERPPGIINQTETRVSAGNFQHVGLLTGPLNSSVHSAGADALLPSRIPSPKSPLIFLRGQGASPGGWFELEPVDIEHPERIPPISIGGSPKVIAEQILEALVGYAEQPTSAAVQSALPDCSLFEPLSSVEQAGILDRVRGQPAEESRAGGGQANMAATGAPGWAPGYASRGPA